MLPAVRSVPAGGSGECESATAWTGEKRRKTTCPSPLGSPDDATDMMDIQLQEGQGGGRGGGQRHPPEDNEIGDEELNLCLRKVKSRKPTIFLPTATMINNLRKIEELHQRFHQLRMEEYSKVLCAGLGYSNYSCCLKLTAYPWITPPSSLNCI
jgi:hypothetical protein